MPSVPASSSSSSSNNFPKQRKRWTRDQILSNLQILGDIAAPLPPVLPPSPPASRSSSPAPALSTKRRSDSAVDSDHIKRLRTTSTSSSSHRPAYPPHHHQQHSSHQHSHPLQHQLLPPPPLPSSHTRDSPAPPQPPPPSSRSEPAEDGEVREEPPSNERGSAVQTGPSSLAPSQVPIRRPRKGKLTSRHFDDLHDQYHNAGRLLKYSGDARFWSTYPPSHREFRPLANPPPPGSPYHKHGGLIARLELVDALVCFAYSIWNRDYGRRQCNRETWRTIEAFLGWCKQKWQAEDAINDAEKAFIGLIWMMEAFIHGRKMQYAVRSYLDRDMDAVQRRTKEKIAAAAEAAQKADDNGLLGVNAALLAAGKSQATPTMLPSPASIAPANSANSTPTGRGDGTPNTANSRAGPSSAQPPARASAQPSGPLLVPKSLMPKYLSEGSQPIPQHVNEAMAAVTEPITPNMVHNLKDLTAAVSAAGYCMMASQNTLNLPTMARHFPITFARMMHTSLGPSEEHEPDFEDEEGELFWPGQLMTGEGLGWVCLMGKAMIKEFGKAYGYKGLDGVVPKPNPGEQMDDGGDAAQRAQQPQLSNTQSSGSTPLGQHGQPPRNYSSSSSHPQQGPSGSLQVPR